MAKKSFLWGLLALAALLATLALVVTGCDNGTTGEDEQKTGFVAVTGISGVPDTAYQGEALTLTGTVEPADATNKTIVWSGEGVAGGELTATAAGTVTVTATIAKGLSESADYTTTFSITVRPPEVTGVTVSGPSVAAPGGTATFTASIEGRGSPLSRGVRWSVTASAIQAGTTMSAIGALTVAANEADGTELTVTAASTADPSLSGSETIMVRDPKAAAGEAVTKVDEAADAAGLKSALSGVPGVVVPEGFAEAVEAAEDFDAVKGKVKELLGAIANAETASVQAAVKALNAYLREMTPISSVDALEAYLAALSGTSAESPASVPLALNISDNWGGINTAVRDAGKYVVLDLSASSATSNTITGTSYSPSGNDMNVIKENSYIKGVVLPDTLTAISRSAFCNCTSLTSITIPGSVTSIGWGAFYGCTSLTTVIIPEGVTTIDYETFRDCTSLTSVTIPSSVTKISGLAFYQCTSLTSVTIPGSVTSIGMYAFYQCTSLTSVTIPNSVAAISVRAFDGCTGLTSVTIPEGVTSISTYVFHGCTGLASVTIPDSVTAISSSAFERCTGLTSVTIPDSVTAIGITAFYACSRLTSVTFGGSATVVVSADAFPSGVSLLTVGSATAGGTAMAAGTYTRESGGETWAKQN